MSGNINSSTALLTEHLRHTPVVSSPLCPVKVTLTDGHPELNRRCNKQHQHNRLQSSRLGRTWPPRNTSLKSRLLRPRQQQKRPRFGRHRVTCPARNRERCPPVRDPARGNYRQKLRQDGDLCAEKYNIYTRRSKGLDPVKAL